MAKTVFVAKERFYSLDLGRIVKAGEVVPDNVARKAQKFGLVEAKTEAPQSTQKKEGER